MSDTPYKILAVGMLDWRATGTDTFFVQINEDEVMFYEAGRDGTVRPVVDEPAPLAYVTSSVEKFNNTYRVTEPVPLAAIDELPRFLGQFEIVTDTECRFTGNVPQE